MDVTRKTYSVFTENMAPCVHGAAFVETSSFVFAI
jgi:hypothetical protein